MRQIKAFFIFVLVTVATVPTMASIFVDKPITVSELPAAAQQFIKTHFAGAEISFATVDNEIMDTDYKVVFTDGRKVEFAKNGEWREVEVKQTPFPMEIVPKPICNYLKSHYPKQKVRQIERQRRGYELKLDNGLELTFDKNYALVEIDD